ncbi:MAG: S46 family peptidase [Sphingobacteriales bacterium]|nr:S46 family peptidase [Sphingobacteriales bacterium]
MKFIKRLLAAFFLFVVIAARADEGMWLPLFLQQLNEKQMRSMGMKITAADIYNINKGSLKDAIVSFGGFCTGEVISDKGLVLTNHHCGFDAVQNHSTLDHNYIRDGFWARNKAEEIPNPGLFVTFIVRIEEVTKAALAGVSPSMTEQERQSLIDKNIAGLRTTVKKEIYQDLFVRSFFEGNQYFLFVTETYKDVRLVGAPPSSIGNFGKDTDNWMWPRHTGDFSMFRIYAGKDNKPADYSIENVPYTPKRSLSISLDGMKEGDFTMVFGFPGRTTQYLHSTAVEQIVKVNDPAKIAIRDKALSVIDGFMRRDEQVKIQYAAKYAGISNAWKKWQGEVLGLTSTNAVEKKKLYEAAFQKKVDANPQLKEQYGALLADLDAAYQELNKYGLARDYFNETLGRIEAFTIGARLNNLAMAKEKNGDKGYREAVPKTAIALGEIYKEYSPEVDKKLFEVLMEKFTRDQPAEFLAPELVTLAKNSDYNFASIADEFYNNADLLNNPSKVLASLEANPDTVLAANKQSKTNQLYIQLNNYYYNTVTKKLNSIQARINQLQRTYMKAQMEVMKEKKFYPDANSTLRVTYGNVKGYQPRDAVKYDFYTYLDGVMDKYKPGDYEFDVPQKLRDLYKNKDFGPYGKNGKMPVCFIAMNHTTGGNSGSPALDAYGNLVGLNFDRVWEGTMSDINYDPSICRNIMVDIRYVLFIIDKYASAGHLVQEMKLVHPGKK